MVGRRRDHIVSLPNAWPSCPASHVAAVVSGDLARYTSRHEGMPFYFFRSNVINSSSGGSTLMFTSKAIRKPSCPLRARLSFPYRHYKLPQHPEPAKYQRAAIPETRRLSQSRRSTQLPLRAAQRRFSAPSIPPVPPRVTRRPNGPSRSLPRQRSETTHTVRSSNLCTALPHAIRIVTSPSAITSPVNARRLPMKTISINFKPSWRRRRRR
ncbi:hypothetical protein EDD85DRAFT_348541 [Armillaria nabsnona]|nr:hypothetical protein EDD85DRAFT_348541 [Armillaria nabsnona]